MMAEVQGSLLQRLRDGDDQEWNRLVRAHADQLERMAKKMGRISRRRDSADELVNSVFKSLFRRVHRKESPTIEDLTVFLRGMVVKKCHERHARNVAQKRDVHLEAHDPGMVDELVQRHATPPEIVVARDAFCRLLAALDPIEQAVFELTLDGHSTLEVGKMLDYSQRSVQLCKKRIQKKAEDLGLERPSARGPRPKQSDLPPQRLGP